MTPTELRIAADRTALEIAWDDGSCSRYGAAFLRAHSRSAQAVRLRIEGRDLPPDSDVRIDDAHLVGAYAVNLVFSDGHDRAIFPWTYLLSLTPR